VNYWTGFYTSRPNTKKMMKDGSANLHASNKLYAQRVINNNTTDQQIKDVMAAKDAMFDSMGVAQHHDAITGTGTQEVDRDYNYRIQSAMDKSNVVYKRELEEALLRHTGVKAKPDSLSNCLGS